ncbi:MAG: hypothetical protein JWO99_405 [Candidatus Saccharibacteria bacterium]|nr:hypothetical protein [Candidatus Saccharibacteria bacterium]
MILDHSAFQKGDGVSEGAPVATDAIERSVTDTEPAKSRFGGRALAERLFPEVTLAIRLQELDDLRIDWFCLGQCLGERVGGVQDLDLNEGLDQELVLLRFGA